MPGIVSEHPEVVRLADLSYIIGSSNYSGSRLQNTGMTSIIVAFIPVIGLLLYGCVNGQGESQ